MAVGAAHAKRVRSYGGPGAGRRVHITATLDGLCICISTRSPGPSTDGSDA